MQLLSQRSFDRLFRDNDGRVVIAQWPNLPLWVWIICKVLSLFLHGQFASIVNVVAVLALCVWAVLEIGWGRNLFRRILGSTVLIAIMVNISVRLLR
ncbi:MAG: hypothetical protein M3R04_01715 [bacterium]|nr:hypothetical protein [bacterium]